MAKKLRSFSAVMREFSTYDDIKRYNVAWGFSDELPYGDDWTLAIIHRNRLDGRVRKWPVLMRGSRINMKHKATHRWLAHKFCLKAAHMLRLNSLQVSRRKLRYGTSEYKHWPFPNNIEQEKAFRIIRDANERFPRQHAGCDIIRYPNSAESFFENGVLKRIQYEEEIEDEPEAEVQEEAQEENSKPGFVYFIADGLGYVKIGKTICSPGTRLSNMQTGHSQQLKLVHSVESVHYDLIERMLHSDYAEHRHRGEWFREECISDAIISANRYASEPFSESYEH